MLNGSKMPSSLAFKCQTWLIFCISVFYWWKQKISHSFGKICKCIWNIWLSLFRKCYGLFWALKIQDFDIVDSANFFLYFYPQYMNSNKDYSINPTIFWNISKRSSRCTCAQYLSSLLSAEYTKNEPFLIFFNDHTA